MKTVILLFLVGSTVLAQEPSDDFRRLDKNNDGKLARDEFKAEYRSIDGFSRVDFDKDGIISADEDQEFMHGRGVQRLPKDPGVTPGHYDIPYALTYDSSQWLRIFLPREPKNKQPLPIVVHVHRGYHPCDIKLLTPLVSSGEYAGVFVECRTDKSEADGPIHDCNAAIRWLRANAKEFNLDPDRIGVAGTYRGGHLAAMLGTSGGVESLEGNVGEHPNVSSRVTCVVDLFGPTDLLAMGGGHNSIESFLGGQSSTTPSSSSAMTRSSCRRCSITQTSDG